MVILPNGSHAYLDEPVQLATGKIAYVTKWLETPHGLVGDGFELKPIDKTSQTFSFDSSTMPIKFAVTDITHAGPALTTTVRIIRDVAGDEVRREHKYRSLAGARPVYVLYLQCAGDDMSGVASTRWNEHLACYFAYASLPPEHRNRECNIRFRSVSMTAKELELVATVDMIRWASLSFLAHQIDGC